MDNIEQVDCILLFMLDEERDLFIKANQRFIIEERDSNSFQKFTFLDKDTHVRHGVMCSGGSEMGMNAAAALIYKVSRHFSASLYINIGVAGILKDVKIGDVVFIDRLSTASENNANNAPYQLRGSSFYQHIDNRSDNIKQAVNRFLNDYSFPQEQQRLYEETFRKINEKITDESRIAGFPSDRNHNICCKGHCISFPEVIKNINGKDMKWFNSNNRLKNALVDMEAYYFCEWFNYIRQEEPNCVPQNAELLVVKSVSDCGNDTKTVYEECGTRKLSMSNISEVITTICCEQYGFTDPIQKDEIWDIIGKSISEQSVLENTLSSLQTGVSDEESVFNAFSKFFQYYVRSDYALWNDNSESSKGLLAALNSLLGINNTAIYITGRTGTGKTTLLSYLYKYLIWRKQKVVFLEIPNFLHNEKTSLDAALYFVSRVVKKDSSAIVLIDGIHSLNENENAYRYIREMLKGGDLHHVVFATNESDAYDAFFSEVESRFDNTIPIRLGGISIDSDMFEEFFSAGIKFFELFHNHSIADDYIRKVLHDENSTPRILNINYLLFYIITKYIYSADRRYRYFYTFLNSYFISNYGTAPFSSFCNEVYQRLTSQDKSMDNRSGNEQYRRISNNPYALYYAYSDSFYKLILSASKEKNRRSIFLQQQILFPCEAFLILMSKLFEGCRTELKAREIYANLADMFDHTEEMSIEMEMQINYLACSFLHSIPEMKESLFKRIKNYRSVLNRRKDTDTELRYRSICIASWLYMKEDKELRLYNRRLLKNQMTRRCNIAFHLCYYSGKMFSIQDITQLNYEYLNEETIIAINNVLKKGLLAEIKDVHSPFFQHNLITILHLWEDIILNNKTLIDACRSVEELFSNIKDRLYKEYKGRNCALLPIIDGVLDKLQRQIDS